MDVMRMIKKPPRTEPRTEATALRLQWAGAGLVVAVLVLLVVRVNR